MTGIHFITTDFLTAGWQPLGALSPRQLLARLGPVRRPFLLESGKGGELGRWSFLGGDPERVLTATDAGVVWSDYRADCRAGDGVDDHLGQLSDRPVTRPVDGGPLAAMRRMLARRAVPRVAGLPPLFGGFVGTFSYDLARRFERIPALADNPDPLPELDLGWYNTVIAVDHRQRRLWVCTLAPGAEGRERVVERFAQLARPVAGEDHPPAVSPPESPVRRLMTRDRFLWMVERAREYIAAGDIFQANLSQRFRVALGGETVSQPQRAWELYRTLSAINPSPFACYMDLGDYQLVSSSPERLVSLRDGEVQARPIAGTRPRGADDRLDRLTGAELLSHPKERAEHVMLVDLMRNDLGRVCDYGSVRVSEFMTTERYSHVIHIVSNVVGRLGPGMDGVSLLRAVFPGGTITGAPKVRCMEIIEELEPVRRGLYTGSAGYLTPCGDMDLNILIRSIVVQNGHATYQTGAGIVADSDPASEFDETLHKAAAMGRALGDGVTVAVP